MITSIIYIPDDIPDTSRLNRLSPTDNLSFWSNNVFPTRSVMQIEAGRFSADINATFNSAVAGTGTIGRVTNFYFSH